jgi:ABC-type sugar transport system permease subunit
MRPVLLVMIMMGFVHAFNSFTLIYIMTGGGPLGATKILAVSIHEYGFKSLSFERAAAASVMLFVIIGACIGVYLKAFWKDAEI